jgi:hypothetical protein
MAEEQEIIEAVCRILGELHRLTNLGLDPRRIDRIRRETIFFLYEGGDAAKWSFERPHSAAARRLHREARALGRSFNSKNYPVTYEHAIPLVTLREGLREAAVSSVAMSAFLQQHIMGVVILKEENERLSKLKLGRVMPSGAVPHDRLARYRKAGIEFEPDDAAMLALLEPLSGQARAERDPPSPYGG